MQALAKELLDGELVLADGDAVDELQRRPQPVELGALVDRQDAVDGRRSRPDGVVQEGADAVQHHLGTGRNNQACR